MHDDMVSVNFTFDGSSVFFPIYKRFFVCLFVWFSIQGIPVFVQFDCTFIRFATCLLPCLLFVCPSVCLPTLLSVCLFVWLAVGLVDCLSCCYLPVSLYVLPFCCKSIYPPASLFQCLIVWLAVWLSFCQAKGLSSRLSVRRLSVCQTVC